MIETVCRAGMKGGRRSVADSDSDRGAQTRHWGTTKEERPLS